MKGNIVVGQSGGPTAVINSSVAGVYAAAKKLGVKKIYGMVHGIEGFLQDKMIDLAEYLDDETGIELLKRTPSAFLGSCRFKMPKIEGHEDVYEKIFEIMEKHDIECLFYAGGNDSMDTVKIHGCSEDDRQRSSDYRPLSGIRLRSQIYCNEHERDHP